MIQALLVVILLAPDGSTNYHDKVAPAPSMEACQKILPDVINDLKKTGLRFVAFCAPVAGGKEI